MQHFPLNRSRTAELLELALVIGAFVGNGAGLLALANAPAALLLPLDRIAELEHGLTASRFAGGLIFVIVAGFFITAGRFAAGDPDRLTRLRRAIPKALLAIGYVFLLIAYATFFSAVSITLA